LNASLAATLAARIQSQGPLRLDHWMAACNAHYYAHQDPLGRDFTTAPEVSQLFGEMIGGWLGDLWQRAGQPPARLVELGPGRGTLMADALRLLTRLPGFPSQPLLIETSPVLRAAQSHTLAAHAPQWLETPDDLPDNTPLLILANEFFDVLPIRQHLGNSQERAVTHDGNSFAPTTLPAPQRDPGETCEAGETLIASLARRLARQGGALLLLDYGDETLPPDTLQALRHAAPASPFEHPGEADLTAHVHFGRLAAAARAAAPVSVHGPVPQGVFLARLGIHARAEALARAQPRAQAAALTAGLVRLTAPALMGARFKAMALTAPGWPTAAGFA
jgi:SAM-dependent MidA family methyltransferase